MDCPPQFGAVVAAPMEDGIGVDDAVARLQFHWNAIGQRYARIFTQLAVLGFGVASAITAGHHP